MHEATAEKIIDAIGKEDIDWDWALDRLPWLGEGRGDMENCTTSLVYFGYIEFTTESPILANEFALRSGAYVDDVSCFTGCPLYPDRCLNAGC